MIIYCCLRFVIYTHMYVSAWLSVPCCNALTVCSLFSWRTSRLMITWKWWRNGIWNRHSLAMILPILLSSTWCLARVSVRLGMSKGEWNVYYSHIHGLCFRFSCQWPYSSLISVSRLLNPICKDNEHHGTWLYLLSWLKRIACFPIDFFVPRPLKESL